MNMLMHKLRRWLAVALICGALPQVTLAEMASTPTVPDLVAFLNTHHPEYQSAVTRTGRIAQERETADAQFDLQLVQETYLRPSGYYDGGYAEQTIIQPIGPMNAQVFGTYRYSDGNFPVYEAEYETLDRGESSVGVKLSLLQNREIDDRRLALDNATWRYSEAQSQQSVQQNRLIFAGVSAYIDWYEHWQKLTVVENLVKLTEDRIKGVATRVESGDLAKISLTEVQAALMRRQLLLLEAQQNLENARHRLNYYFTADPNDTNRVSLNQPPADIAWPYSIAASTAEAFEAEIDGHPAVQALEAKLRQEQNKRQLADNETLPKLDLAMKVARDLGDGMEPLAGTESVVELSFFMPLGQRAAKARKAISEARIRELEYDRQVLKAQIARDITINLTTLQNKRQIYSLGLEQVELASALMEQEQRRFQEGVSDLFLLVNREAQALQAQIKAIEAKSAIFRQEIAVNATLAKLAAAL